MNQWRKDIASWIIDKTLYLSVVFSWHIPRARELARAHHGPVIVGGPAVTLNPHEFVDIAEINGDPVARPLDYHNPLATFTSRGCPNACPFCAVPRIEGDIRELADWPVRPIICDNNLLACSRRHFDHVIDRLRALPYVDFNQGLDARLFTGHHARRIAELKSVKIRFAFDHISIESRVADAIKTARDAGLKDIGCYVLIGFHDNPEDALYRLEKVRSWGIRPTPMRYQPLNTLTKNSFVSPKWTEYELRRMMKYWSRQRYLEHIPYSEFRRQNLTLLDGLETGA